MLFNRASQELGVGSAFHITSIVKLSFTSNTSDHHRLHEHKSRPGAANDVNQTAEIWTSAYQNILIEDEERLYSPNLSPNVLQYKI